MLAHAALKWIGVVFTPWFLLPMSSCASAPVVVTDPKGVADAFLAAKIGGDSEAALELVADDASVRLLRYGLIPSGKEQVRHYLATPGLSFHLVRAPQVDGDRVVWLERVEIVGDGLSQSDDPQSVHSYKIGVEAVVVGGRIISIVETDMRVCPSVC